MISSLVMMHLLVLNWPSERKKCAKRIMQQAAQSYKISRTPSVKTPTIHAIHLPSSIGVELSIPQSVFPLDLRDSDVRLLAAKLSHITDDFGLQVLNMSID
jgi:hypothetical protein